MFCATLETEHYLGYTYAKILFVIYLKFKFTWVSAFYLTTLSPPCLSVPPIAEWNILSHIEVSWRPLLSQVQALQCSRSQEQEAAFPSESLRSFHIPILGPSMTDPGNIHSSQGSPTQTQNNAVFPSAPRASEQSSQHISWSCIAVLELAGPVWRMSMESRWPQAMPVSL